MPTPTAILDPKGQRDLQLRSLGFRGLGFRVGTRKELVVTEAPTFSSPRQPALKSISADKIATNRPREKTSLKKENKRSPPIDKPETPQHPHRRSSSNLPPQRDTPSPSQSRRSPTCGKRR